MSKKGMSNLKGPYTEIWEGDKLYFVGHIYNRYIEKRTTKVKHLKKYIEDLIYD